MVNLLKMADTYEEDILYAFILCSSLESLQLTLSALVLIAFAETTSKTSALCVDQELPIADRSHYAAYILIRDLLEFESTKIYGKATTSLHLEML
jgi:hypothetical protein